MPCLPQVGTGKRQHWEPIPVTVTSIKDTNQTTQKAKLLGWKENLVWAILAVCGLGVW